MRMSRPQTLLLGLLSFSIVLFASSLWSEEVELPSEVYFNTPVASVHGQNSVWTNPAALGNRQSGSMLIFTHRNNRVIRDWGTVTTTSALAMSYRFVHGNGQTDYRDIIIAIGGGKRTGFGLSYQYIKDGPGYLNNRHLWNAGLLFRYNRNVSLGARFENLNRGKINGKRSDIRYLYGIAARTYRNRLTVTFDVDMTSKETLDNADFRTGVEYRPKPGMYLYADVDNHSRFNLGFRLNLLSNYVGNRTEFDREGKSYLSTSYIGSVKGKQASLIKPRRKTLMMNLSGTLPENPDVPFIGQRPLRFFDYVEGIYRAAEDEEIDRIFLHIKKLHCGLGKVEEISDAITYFRNQNKQVYAYLSSPSNLGYLLASHADSIFIPPVSQLRLTGLSGELMMYKGLLDKLGVQLEIERVDEYKTAPEQYLFDRPTEPNREQLNRLLDKLYDEFTNVIAANRSLSIDSVQTIIDSAPITSLAAVNWGLVDDRMYYDDAVRELAEDEFTVFSRKLAFSEYVQRECYNDRWERKPQIAVVLADGNIVQGSSGGKIGGHEMLGSIRRARYDSDIDGVVLRINSPGGDALASDLIWHEINKLAENKPVIVSMGNMAASGGYYMAMVNNKIMANKNTLTGSIGVFGGKINFAELYSKIGLYTESFDRGKNASMYSTSKPFTPQQREKLRSHLWEFYHHFLSKVADVRPLSVDSVNSIGRGQVWTGSEAVSNGLVDELGGIHHAIMGMAQALGCNSLDDIEIVSLPVKRFWLKNPFDFKFYSSQLLALLHGAEKSATTLNALEEGNIFFRIPYDIEIE
ncbi:MAG: signal peptide peptidase SppA [candidate division Zixibacteria bacterium]|nr:signal peptide peptidase SppA [candidate division Zixibacteria bacterium]